MTMVFLPLLAEGKDVGKYTLPEGHLFGMKVPKGGSSCAKCRFISRDGKHCGNAYFQDWRRSLGVPEANVLPAPADEYCCDVFAEPEGKQAAFLARVVARYRTSAVLDEKMKALLLKLRKGADSSLSIPQFFKVVALLGGWRVEEIVGLIPIHYPRGEVEREMLQHIHSDNEQEARAFYDKVKSHEVSNLPTNPQLGQLYVMDLAPFKSWQDTWDATKMNHGAGYKLWVGVPGYRITDPNGKVFELLPNRHDVKESHRDNVLPTIDAKGLKKKLRPWDMLKWAKAHTTWLAQINEILGLDPHEKSGPGGRPAMPRTRENTGTCGACLRNIKLVWKSDQLPTMALHGYNRPGHGYVIGKCFGGDHPPYELSPEGTKIMLGYIKQQFEGTKEVVEFFKGSPEKFEHQKRTYDKAVDPEAWEFGLKHALASAESALHFPAMDFKAYSWLVDHWEKRDLPQEGTSHIDWYLQALRSTGGKEASLVLRVALSAL